MALPALVRQARVCRARVSFFLLFSFMLVSPFCLLVLDRISHILKVTAVSRVFFSLSLSGKTLLAKSAARDSNAHVLLVNGPSIVVSGYGDTEKALKSLFDAAIEIGNTSVRSSKLSKANR